MTTKTRPAPWTLEENRSLVNLYFNMLDKAHAGATYNKAALIRLWRGEPEGVVGPLHNRSRGSIDAKLMNCSAAHRDLIHAAGNVAEFQTMAHYGYKAWGNYQKHLKDCITDELQNREIRDEDAEVRRNEQRAGA